MSDRIPCTNPDCKNTILPATAAANSGLCAPCMIAIAKKERDEFIRLNRKTVDQYEGITDPVERAVIMLSPRKHDPLIVYAPAPIGMEELFASLTEEQAHRLACAARKALEDDNTDLAEGIAKSLATLTDYDFTEMLHAWVARGHHWPAIIFRNAKPDIRDAIIASLDRGTANANHALSALAWIGDEVVQRVFLRWDAEKPTWSSKLYIPSSGYGVVGGWQMTKDGRRALIHEQCFGLAETSRDTADLSVKTFLPASQPCPWCSHELSWMLDIDLTDSRFGFLAPGANRLRILTCHGCTSYGDGFVSKIDLNGDTSPHPLAVKPKWLPDTSAPWEPPAWRDVAVSITPRSAIHAADWCMQLRSSQIGGHPCWVQDSTYPACPECSNTMRFIAQLNEDDFPGNEGTYYAFMCSECRTTATSYQQT